MFDMDVWISLLDISVPQILDIRRDNLHRQILWPFHRRTYAIVRVALHYWRRTPEMMVTISLKKYLPTSQR